MQFELLSVHYHILAVSTDIKRNIDSNSIDHFIRYFAGAEPLKLSGVKFVQNYVSNFYISPTGKDDHSTTGIGF